MSPGDTWCHRMTPNVIAWRSNVVIQCPSISCLMQIWQWFWSWVYSSTLSYWKPIFLVCQTWQSYKLINISAHSCVRRYSLSNCVLQYPSLQHEYSFYVLYWMERECLWTHCSNWANICWKSAVWCLYPKVDLLAVYRQPYMFWCSPQREKCSQNCDREI